MVSGDGLEPTAATLVFMSSFSLLASHPLAVDVMSVQHELATEDNPRMLSQAKFVVAESAAGRPPLLLRANDRLVGPVPSSLLEVFAGLSRSSPVARPQTEKRCYYFIK